MGSLAPQDMSFFDTAAVRSTSAVECPAPARAVFDVLADHRRFPEWLGMGVSSVEPTSRPESGVGATRTLTIGRGLVQVREKFIAWDEPAVWAFTAVGFRPAVFRKFVEGFWLEPLAADRCRITYRMGCELVAPLKPMSGVLGRVWSRAFVGALSNLSAEAVRRHRVNPQV